MQKRFYKQVFALTFIAAILIVVLPLHVFANTVLGTRSDQISTSQAGANAIHRFTIRMLNTTTAVGSISFEFCSNSPTPGTSCTAPTGFDISSASLASQSGDTGFSIHPSTTSNRMVLTRAASNPGGVTSVYQFNNIVNPTVGGSHYVRIQTYGSLDATGTDIEYGGVVFSISKLINVNAEVPPYIRFCVAVTIVSFDCSTATSFLIDFGELRPTVTSKATTQFVVASNATNGYSVTVNGTTLTSGSNIIPALAVPTAATQGSSQFGINLRSNTVPGIGDEVVGPGTSVASAGYNISNSYKFQTGDTIVSVGTSDANRKFTVSYITNISSSQTAGVYATTISYICLANF